MPPLSRDCEVLWIAGFNYRPGQRVEMHAHQHHQLICPRDGSVGMQIEATPHRLLTGELALLPPGCRHSLRLAGRCRTLDVKFRVRRPALRQALAQLPVVLPADRALPHLEAMLADAAAGTQPRAWAVQARLQLLLVELLAAPAPAPAAPPPEPSLDPVVARLQELLRDARVLGDSGQQLAARCGYSYRYLAACCRRACGRTPRQLAQAARFDRACQLLGYGERAVKAVGSELGFADVHHFSRWFRARSGCGPATWRRRTGSGAESGIVLSEGFENLNLVVTDTELE